MALLSVLTVAPLLALMVAETAAEPRCSPTNPCRAVLRSTTYWTDAPIVFVAYTLLLLPFLVPRIAVWCASVLAIAMLATAGTTSYPLGWAVAALFWTVLGGLEVRGRLRQCRLSASWAGPVEQLALSDRRLRWDEDTRRLGGVVALVLLLGAAGLAITHAVALSDVERFEAAATRTVGTVTDPGEEGPLVVEVAGRPYEVELPIETYHQGEDVPVLIDPSTGRTALVAEPDDPSWLLGWAAVAVVLAGCFWVTLWSRGRRRVDLLQHGGPTFELLLLEGRFTVLSDIQPFDRRRELVIGDLAPVELAFVEQPHPRRAADQSPEPATHKEQLRSPEQLSDTEVKAWSDHLNDEEMEQDDLDEVAPPRQVTVIGHLLDGFPVLVRDGQHLLLAARPVRDPWMFRRLARRTDTKPLDDDGEDDESQPSTRRPTRLFLVVAVLLAVPAGLGLWWLFDDPTIPFTWTDLFALLALAGALAVGLHQLADTGSAVLAPHPHGLRLRSPLLTTVLTAHQVMDVVTAKHSIVLRLRNPADLIDVNAASVAGSQATATDAADRVRYWLKQSDATEVRWHRRPSPSLAPPALMLLTLAISFLH